MVPSSSEPQLTFFFTGLWSHRCTSTSMPTTSGESQFRHTDFRTEKHCQRSFLVETFCQKLYDPFPKHWRCILLRSHSWVLQTQLIHSSTSYTYTNLSWSTLVCSPFHLCTWTFLHDILSHQMTLHGWRQQIGASIHWNPRTTISLISFYSVFATGKVPYRCQDMICLWFWSRAYRRRHDCELSLPIIWQRILSFNQGIIGGSVQLFFAWRIHVITKNMFVVSAVVLLSVASVLGSVGTTIGNRIVPQFDQFQKFEFTVVIWLAGAACADMLIATALVMHLVGDVVNPYFSYVNLTITAEE